MEIIFLLLILILVPVYIVLCFIVGYTGAWFCDKKLSKFLKGFE